MIHLQFKPEVVVNHLSQEEASISSSQKIFRWKHPSTALLKSLDQLLEGVSESALGEIWEREFLPEHDFYYFLEKLKQRALLSHTLLGKEGPLFTLIPHQPFQGPPFLLSQTVQLSRFAYLRNHNGSLIWENPFVSAEIRIKHPRCLEIFYALATPKTVAALVQEHAWLSEETLFHFLSLLHQASFLRKEEEVSSPSLVCWEFHDLLFHARNRRGRSSAPSGGTFRFLHKIPPWPAVSPRSESPAIPLFRPDLEGLMKKDRPFSAVLERRSSIRDHGKKPISLQQLGEFFFRAARIKEHRKDGPYETTQRPYPGGGACYELELYPLIFQCEGISQGLYRYHPDIHALSLCAPWNPDLEKLLEDTAEATAKTAPPQIAILIAARFQRISWKYQSMAYAVTLKNAGALIQTLYLVATAMDLAPCAVGGGDSNLFAKAALTSYYEETTVAEFILGSK